MITGIYGLPGSGKSLYALRLMMKKKAQGKRILANFHTKGDIAEFALWDQMIDAQNAICVIDEAHVWFPSRAWKSNTVLDLLHFQQHRKDGLDIYWIAQDPQRIDVALRELSAWYIHCRRLGPLIWARLHDPLDTSGKSYGSDFFLIKPELYRHYWTEERIGQRDGKGYGFGKTDAVERMDPVYRLIDAQADAIRYVRESDSRLPDLMMRHRMGGYGEPDLMYWDPMLKEFRPLVRPGIAVRDEYREVQRPAEVDVTVKVQMQKKRRLFGLG